MKGTPLKYSRYATKMEGRNISTRFAAYKSDGNETVEAEEKAFQDSIKDLPQETKAVVIAARKAFIDKLQTVQANMLTKEEAEPMITGLLEEYKGTPEAVKELKEILAKHGQALTALKSGITSGYVSPATLKQQIAKAFEDNKEAIKNSVSGTPVKMELKAVDIISTGSSTSPTAPPTYFGAQVAPPSEAAIRPDNVMDLVTSLDTSLAAYPYTETLPKDGSFVFQNGEGALKDQIDFKTETRYATPVTLAAYEVLTTQSVEDIPGLQSIAANILMKKHDRKKSNAILYGTGVAGQCKGATVYASAFSVPAALSEMVEKPNIMDIINAMATTINMTHDYTDQLGYIPNIAAVNPYDFYLQFTAAKDANGLPLYPTATIFNQVTIGNMTIRPMEDITAGYIFVGDLSRYYVSNYIGFTVTIGRINDDFIKNQFVMLGESRFHAFVKKLDEKAFMYDTIDNVKLAIQKTA